MTDIAKAYVQIVPSAKGISGSISEVLNDEAEKSGSNAGKKIASLLKGAIAGAGIGEAIKASLEAGGALQQSFLGGLDTLYGDAADQMREYASAAAEAGISANDYAEQAVSFGAALKKSFEGAEDAELKAGEAANKAIMDMADNSAKMGTDLGSIQAAYQGFAKQNYSMLDNLKLGYGGTKTEMEKLLKDATKLSGVKYDIDNLSDVYDAIHVIQEDLGLTGVAAGEAKETLTGSFGAVKASLQNLMGFISLGMDVTPALTQLVTSVSNFLFGNLIPMLWNIVKAIPAVLQTLFSTIAPQIGAVFTQTMNNLPELLQTGVQLINSVVDGILTGIPGFINTVMQLGLTFMNTIFDSLPGILQAGANIILNLVNGIITNFPAIVQAAANMLAQFNATILQKLPTILQKGIEIIGQLVAGLISAIPDIIRAIPQIIRSIVNAFSQFNWLQIGVDIIRGIANGISSAAGLIVDAAKNAARSAFEAAKNFLQIGSPSKLAEKEIGMQFDAGMAKGLINAASLVKNAMATVVSATDLSGYNIFGDMTSGGVQRSAGGFNQTVNIYSPRELAPSEVARQTRNATQQVVLQLSGV